MTARRAGAIVFGAVFGLRLVLWAAMAATPLADWWAWRETDDHTFLAWSARLAAGNALDDPAFRTYYAWQVPSGSREEWMGRFVANGYFQTPLWPYLLAGLRRVFGDPVAPARALSALAAAAAAALLATRVATVAVGRRGGWLAGLAGGLLYGLFAPGAFHDLSLGRDGLVTHASTLLVLLPIGGAAGWKRSLGTGFAAGFSALLKQTLLPLGVAAAVVAVWRCGAGSSRRRATASALVGLALPLGLLAARNLAVGVPPFLFDARQAMTLVWANAPGAEGLVLPPPAEFRLLDATRGAVGPTLRGLRERWRGNEGGWFRMIGVKAACFFLEHERPDNANFYFFRDRIALLRFLPTFPGLLGAGVVGLVWAFATRLLARDAALLLAISLVGTFASCLATQPLSRYRVAAAGPLALGAGLLVVLVAERLAARDAPRLAGAAVAVGALSAASLLPPPVASPRHRFTDTYVYATLLEADGKPDAAVRELERYAREGTDDPHRPRAAGWADAWLDGERPDSLEPWAVAPPERRYRRPK